ncbi:collagen alpha-1(III) chain-like [Corvus moneduloides]|uniref:collagen alpha-1(III) chain-like n=1 Tax=Corvus moneduloides TaxID=1196302 RepID=UPI00136345CB|nr:collagen alpha-1(III) chain-like [Corvus moneduloides]
MPPRVPFPRCPHPTPQPDTGLRGPFPGFGAVSAHPGHRFPTGALGCAPGVTATSAALRKPGTPGILGRLGNKGCSALGDISLRHQPAVPYSPDPNWPLPKPKYLPKLQRFLPSPDPNGTARDPKTRRGGTGGHGATTRLSRGHSRCPSPHGDIAATVAPPSRGLAAVSPPQCHPGWLGDTPGTRRGLREGTKVAFGEQQSQRQRPENPAGSNSLEFPCRGWEFRGGRKIPGMSCAQKWGGGNGIPGFFPFPPQEQQSQRQQKLRPENPAGSFPGIPVPGVGISGREKNSRDVLCTETGWGEWDPVILGREKIPGARRAPKWGERMGSRFISLSTPEQQSQRSDNPAGSNSCAGLGISGQEKNSRGAPGTEMG